MNVENNETSALPAIPELTLFSGLNMEEASLVAGFLKTTFVKKGETVFKEGDTGKDMFIVLSGTLRAYGTQSDGTQRWLFDEKQGEFFGEMSIIAHEPRSATITAAEDSTIIILSETDFFGIIEKHPIIGFKILRTISAVQHSWLDQSSKSYSDLIRWGETARKRAITDEMTGLYNRRFLEETLKERFSNQSMNLRIMSLLMMDLDNIHGINNRYGQKAGDLVIISAAKVIRSCLRPGDIPARLSGDEFAILLPDTNEKDAATAANRIREIIEKQQIEVPENSVSEKNVFISGCTSIGIAVAPIHAKTTGELFEASDSALRKAKELGRNRVEIFR